MDFEARILELEKQIVSLKRSYYRDMADRWSTGSGLCLFVWKGVLGVEDGVAFALAGDEADARTLCLLSNPCLKGDDGFVKSPVVYCEPHAFYIWGGYK